MNHLMQRPGFGFLQTITPNDSIDSFLIKYYGLHHSQREVLRTLREFMLQLNPELNSSKEPFRGRKPRTLDFISTDPYYFRCVAETVVRMRIEKTLWLSDYEAVDRVAKYTPTHPDEKKVFNFLANLSEHYSLEDALSTGVGVYTHMTGERNQAVLRQLADLHTQREAGGVSRNAFKLRKKELIDSYLKATGPLGRFLHGEKDLYSALQKNPMDGMPPSQKFVKHADRLASLAKKARIGGVVLMATGAFVTARNVCAEEDTYERNVHLVRGVGSLAGGLAGGAMAGFLVGALVVTGPVGWGIALVVSAATSATIGDGVASVAHILYDKYGNEFDIASSTGLTRICQ